MLKKILGKNKRPEMYKRSYSQDGEDMMLNSVFDDLGGRASGFFIDVGALHPYRFSNTAYFYERGWSGINIEPTPDAITFFNEVRQRDININCGINDVEDELLFYVFDEPALNSFSRSLAEERALNPNDRIIDKIKIPVKRLDSVLDQYLKPGQHIDFLTIDVEGLDFKVLKSNNWDKYVPDFILVEEMSDLEALGKGEIHKFLKEKAYTAIGKTPRTFLYQHESVK
ncbi:MAG: FkbM family methyltransferase [Pedobacter sp.]|nr:FkbM family methyltransferase [Pedobacter sp.]